MARLSFRYEAHAAHSVLGGHHWHHSSRYRGRNRLGSTRAFGGEKLARREGETSPSGQLVALVTRRGERVDLTEVIKEHPTPSSKRDIGYWFTPTMDWLGGQNIRVTTAFEAKDVVRLWHTLWQGPSFAPQKNLRSRRFGLAWVVTVEHDFTNYPGNIRVTRTYELAVNENYVLQSFRQRCFHYPGSAQVYTNTVQTVYDREISLNKGRNLRTFRQCITVQNRCKPGVERCNHVQLQSPSTSLEPST